jgi:putative phage-type endonuclease
MINEQILEARKTGIGGSDVAAVLGLSRYKTPADIWLEKTGRLQPESGNEFTYWGQRLESIIADEYAVRNGYLLDEPVEMFRHKKLPFLIANPDRLIRGKNGILECKTAGAYKISEWGEEGTDQIPTEYLLQAAHYRYVLDANFVDIAVLIGGNAYRQYKYDKNERLEEKIMEKLTVFWEENVIKDVKPEPKTRRDVEILFRETDKVMEADEELEKDLMQMAELKRKSSETEKELAQLQDKICVRIGEASCVVNKIGEKMCTWKSVLSKRFDSATFKKERTDEYNQYLKESASRVLRLSHACNVGG